MSRDNDIVPRQSHERLPPAETKGVENKADGATIPDIGQRDNRVALAKLDRLKRDMLKRFEELEAELKR